MISLRPDQTRTKDAARQAIVSGVRRLLVVAPCGAGKTVIMSEIVRGYLLRSKRPTIVIVHRRELVDQTLEKLAWNGIQAGVVMASDSRSDRDLPVQVCSIQTLQRRESIPAAGLVLYDECHHSASAGARSVLDRYPDAIVIGFTATPWRHDRIGLADIYQRHIVAATPRELISLGILVPIECSAYDSPDLHSVRRCAGDFNAKDLELACNTGVIVGSAIEEYLTHARGRPAIVFPVSVEHSKSVVAEFRARGISARHLDWKTPKDERAAMLAAFRRREIDVLSSCGVLSEGFDAPIAEVAILMRPTMSLGRYLQEVGRVMRSAPGKRSALLHDHAGNCFRHGFPDDDRDYTPGATPEQLSSPTVCLDCGAVVRAWGSDGLCPRCGSLQAMPDEKRTAGEARRGKITISGIRIGRSEIEAIRARFAERGRELNPEQALKVSRATRDDKAAEYLRLRSVAERRGFQPGFVAHKYRETFGVWPRFADGELETAKPAVTPFLPLPKRSEINAGEMQRAGFQNDERNSEENQRG